MKTDPKHEDKRVAFDRACDMLAKAADEARERERADFLIKAQARLDFVKEVGGERMTYYIAKHIGDGVWSLTLQDDPAQEPILCEGVQAMYKWASAKLSWSIYYPMCEVNDRPRCAIDPFFILNVPHVYRDGELIHGRE